jgi:hypothetical protein
MHLLRRIMMTDTVKKGRDEKGLTLGHRSMLRLLVVFNQTGTAAAKVDDTTDIGYLLGTPLVASAVQDLLVFATALGEKIGSPEKIAAYLNMHAAEDNAFFEKQRADHYAAAKAAKHAELLDDLKAVLDGPPCDECEQPTCNVCKGCHSCDSGEEEKTPAPTLN